MEELAGEIGNTCRSALELVGETRRASQHRSRKVHNDQRRKRSQENRRIRFLELQELMWLARSRCLRIHYILRSKGNRGAELRRSFHKQAKTGGSTLCNSLASALAKARRLSRQLNQGKTDCRTGCFHRVAALSFDEAQPEMFAAKHYLKSILTQINRDIDDVLTMSVEGVKLSGSSLLNALKKCQPW